MAKQDSIKITILKLFCSTVSVKLQMDEAPKTHCADPLTIINDHLCPSVVAVHNSNLFRKYPKIPKAFNFNERSRIAIIFLINQPPFNFNGEFLIDSLTLILSSKPPVNEYEICVLILINNEFVTSLIELNLLANNFLYFGVKHRNKENYYYKIYCSIGAPCERFCPVRFQEVKVRPNHSAASAAERCLSVISLRKQESGPSEASRSVTFQNSVLKSIRVNYLIFALPPISIRQYSLSGTGLSSCV